MKLYFLDECLGEIKDASSEGMWMNGKITPTENMEKFKELFAALVDEENEFQEEDYNGEWLDDENWSITEDDGKKRGIDLPAVYPDGEINWRWS
ncbi:hypothetical protein [Priestia filamentosa]|uniref:hypothetical protein n=1 Tax=Priestia filamentosa TaxID=1402861 RepID=UPI00397860EC